MKFDNFVELCGFFFNFDILIEGERERETGSQTDKTREKEKTTENEKTVTEKDSER